MSQRSSTFCLPILLALAALPAVAQTESEEDFVPIPFGDPAGLAYEVPFFPGAHYDPEIPTPDELLGRRHASRPTHHSEILECFRHWSEVSPRMSLHTYGQSHEGRSLVYAVVTTPRNLARLDGIRAALESLNDPRGLESGEAQRIVRETPAVAWLGYSIHGDELSGCDAALALAHHLIASQDEAVLELLQRVVVVIDPVMNPDGRERIVGMVEQAAGITPNLDYESWHRGHWPYGRGNHYLFDMNRDWLAGTQPETRGRWRAILSFHPQLLVDAHEMGSLDTYLFYPQAPPFHPHLAPELDRWQRLYGASIASAFDAHGWSYYTREWADAWGPFYSDAWGSLTGGVGILYEQAGTAGSSLRRASGEVLTFRESVHHQVVASLANVAALAERREEALTHYLENKRRNVAAETEGNDRMFVVHPDGNPHRLRELVRILNGQGIEVLRADASFEARNATSHLGESSESVELPAGSLIVPARQPMRQLVRAYLDFDPRMDLEALELERRDLERTGESRIYDLTCWSLPHALDVQSWWCDVAAVESAPRTAIPLTPPLLVHEDSEKPPVAWIVDGEDDASVAFAARAMELGLQVHFADEPFGAAPHPPGSLLVRLHENQGDAAQVQEKILAAATSAGVGEVRAVTTSYSTTDGPDLGGQHFHLLARPRVALLANAPLSVDRYGHLWHHLDRALGVPFTILEVQRLGRYDLRRYNVLILPPGRGGVSAVLEPAQEKLEAWIRAGGTLIACGGSAAALTREELGLSSVVLRRDALEELASFERATAREWAAREITIDEALVWGDSAPAEEADPNGAEEKTEKAKPAEKDPKIREEEDRWARTFSPRGVSLRALVHPGEWIAAGVGEEMPVYFTGSNVFLSKAPVRTPLRIAQEERLRLGGLVWPEARQRLAGSAWLTVERLGKGQVILFAATPAFRGYHLATGRLFANAVVYGPGMGAAQPIGW